MPDKEKPVTLEDNPYAEHLARAMDLMSDAKFRRDVPDRVQNAIFNFLVGALCMQGVPWEDALDLAGTATAVMFDPDNPRSLPTLLQKMQQ